MKRKKGNIPTIGLLASSLYDQYQEDIWTGVQNQAAVQGVRVHCFAGGALKDSGEHHKSHNALYNLVNSANVDALVILSGCVGVYTGMQGIIQLLQQCPGIPAVSIGVDIPDIPSIVIDNKMGMYNLVFHMIDTHGCKRIAFISGTEKNEEANARFQAYKQALRDHNIPFDPDLVSQGNFDPQSGLKAVRLLVDKRKVTFDALIGVDDRSVLFAMEPLKQRGFALPSDIKVAGFDDIENSQCSFPSLTTVRQPLFELGSLGLKSAVDLLHGKPVPHIQQLRTNLIIRNSCGCSHLDIMPPLTLTVRLKGKRLSNIKNLRASIMSKLSEIYSLHLFNLKSVNLFNKVEVILNFIFESLDTQSSDTKLIDLFKETILQFHSKRVTFPMWKNILTSIFQKLFNSFSSDKKRSVINTLWNKLI